CVARSLRGSSPNNVVATWRRRRTSHRPASRAGIVDTCVLRIWSRRRWNSLPSRSETSLVPYQLQTSTSPSWRWRSSARASALGDLVDVGAHDLSHAAVPVRERVLEAAAE